MLINNIELVVQYPVGTGYACRGFTGLKIRDPVFLLFDSPTLSGKAEAKVLGEYLCGELPLYAGITEELSMPCSGHRDAIYCHALDESACKKLLIRITGVDGKNASHYHTDKLWGINSSSGNWDVLPVMQSGTDPASHLPIQWRGINVFFWTRHIREATMPIMQRIGLNPEENRIFISYVRKDSSAIADQLFDELTHNGFDVFLDRFSVPVGVQFQERLMQDLSDKAMVVFLNSTGVSSSEWVEAYSFTSLHWQRRNSQSLASASDGVLQVRPGGMPTAAASVDDTGQQGEVTRAFWRAGAVADLPQDHPMTQGAFGLVVGQGPKRVFQDAKDRLPVIQELKCKRVCFFVGIPLHCLAAGTKSS